MSNVVAVSVTGGPFLPAAAPPLAFYKEIRQLFPTDSSFRTFRDFVYGKYEAYGYGEGLSLEETTAFVLYCWDMQDARLTSPYQRLNTESALRKLSPECVSFYHVLKSTHTCSVACRAASRRFLITKPVARSVSSSSCRRRPTAKSRRDSQGGQGRS